MSIEPKEPQLHNVEAGILKTVSGRLVDYRNPQPEMFNAIDIATGLAHECRFGGQLEFHYSVAQHSLLVHALAPKELKLLALMHDAPEAYLKDIPKPLKVILGSTYSDIEQAFEKAIFQQFNIEQDVKLIKEYDMRAVEMEDAALRKKDPVAIDELNLLWLKHYGYDYNTYSPHEIRYLFIQVLDWYPVDLMRCK